MHRLSIAVLSLWLALSPAMAQMNSFFPGPGTVHSTGSGSVTVLDVGTDSLISGAGPSTPFVPITTVNASANAALCAVVFTSAGNATYATSPTGTWDSGGGSPQSMTLISAASQNATNVTQSVQTLLFGLLSPHTGASINVQFNWSTNSINGYANCMTFSGANGTFGTAFQNGTPNTGSTTTPTVTITSASSNVAVAVFSSVAGASAGFSSSNCGGSCTQLFLDNSGAGGNGAGAYKTSPSGSQVISAVIGNAATWAASGVTVSP